MYQKLKTSLKNVNLPKILIVGILSFTYYLIVFKSYSGRSDQFGEAFQDWLISLPILVFPLVPRKFWQSMMSFFIVTIPVSFLGIVNSTLGDWAPITSYLYYNVCIFALILIGRFFMWLMDRYGYKIKRVLLAVFALVLVSLIFYSASISILATKKLANSNLYSNLRCAGNGIAVEEFQRICEQLSTTMEKYYVEICYSELELKRKTGSMSNEFQTCPVENIFINYDNGLEFILPNGYVVESNDYGVSAEKAKSFFFRKKESNYNNIPALHVSMRLLSADETLQMLAGLIYEMNKAQNFTASDLRLAEYGGVSAYEFDLRDSYIDPETYLLLDLPGGKVVFLNQNGRMFRFLQTGADSQLSNILNSVEFR